MCDCEQRCKQLLADSLAAQQQERDVRGELAAAREQQAAAQRALSQQTQRLLAAERMRLTDLRVSSAMQGWCCVARGCVWCWRTEHTRFNVCTSKGQRAVGFVVSHSAAPTAAGNTRP